MVEGVGEHQASVRRECQVEWVVQGCARRWRSVAAVAGLACAGDDADGPFNCWRRLHGDLPLFCRTVVVGGLVSSVRSRKVAATRGKINGYPCGDGV